MIEKIEIENLGPIKQASINQLGQVNLIIGENGAGKSFLLKALYAIHKSVEEVGKGDDIRKINDIISEKLRWTFQADAIGELVNDDASACEVFIEDDNSAFSMRFGKKASVAVNDVVNNIGRLSYNSIFIPAREVFSVQKIILRSRDIEKVFGFDDSQYDLAKALQYMPSGKDCIVGDSYDGLKDMMGGSIELDDTSNKWLFMQNGKLHTIGTASDGIRKLGLLDRVLENGYVSDKSIVFIDEIEAGLHPNAIIKLLDVIDSIAQKTNIQFFISSHSYFVIKKVYLMALKNKGRKDYIKCLQSQDGFFTVDDLSGGMPRNPIIEESVRLYEEEVDEVF